jgi:hypothetical protein
MAGGLSHISPSMSTPLAPFPAPRHGEVELKWVKLANCGSFVMFPVPIDGSGVVQQELKEANVEKLALCGAEL